MIDIGRTNYSEQHLPRQMVLNSMNKLPEYKVAYGPARMQHPPLFLFGCEVSSPLWNRELAQPIRSSHSSFPSDLPRQRVITCMLK